MAHEYRAISQLGTFAGPGGEVPIYGTESITLEAATKLETSDMGVTGKALGLWTGAEAPVWNFNFEIVAGISPCSNRDILLQYASRMHSWVWPAATTGAYGVPPPVRCILTGILESNGVIRRVSTELKGPWSAQAPKPLSIVFSGEFVVLPSWTNSGMKIAQIADLFTSTKVAGSFYVFS